MGTDNKSPDGNVKDFVLIVDMQYYIFTEVKNNRLLFHPLLPPLLPIIFKY